MVYGLAILLPSVALWIDGQRISAFLNLMICGASVYYALTWPLFALLLAGPLHALVLIYLTSATRFGRRQAEASVRMPPAGRKGRNRAG
jgi:hypothetical protein